MSGLQQVADQIWTVRAPQRFSGIEVGARMTVLRLKGGLLLHSPVTFPAEALHELGPPRWVLAPNLLHHLYVAPWIEAGAEAWCAPGLPEKRSDLRFKGTIEEVGEPFGDEVLAVPLRCFKLTNEVVLLHRPSDTLIVADLVFNFSPKDPWITRLAMRALGGYPGVRTTLLERFGMDRATARAEIDQLLKLNFDRIILSHGEIVESGGKESLARAFSWL